MESIEILLKEWAEFCRYMVKKSAGDSEFRPYQLYEFMEWLKNKYKK